MTVDSKDIGAGVVFVGAALLFSIDALRTLDIGEPMRMGPGFFPLMLACALGMIGMAALIRGFRGATVPIGPIPWKALALIAASPVVFGLALPSLGFLAAVALAAATALFAGERRSFLSGVLLLTAITLFCSAVFYYGLGVQVRLVGPQLGG